MVSVERISVYKVIENLMDNVCHALPNCQRLYTVCFTSTLSLSPLADCRPDDVTLTSMQRHSCYDDKSMTSFV